MSELVENSLLGAFLHDASNDKIVVKAEDIENEGSGIDYKLSYFEPKPGKNYKIKFITNPFGAPILHRTVYKDLPDPTRKGKTFHYTSSGSAKSCTVLELFFEMNNLKKEGDVMATHKIKKFLGNTNQACALIQVLESDDAEEIGIYRMMSFASRGENASIAILVDQKVNPSDADLKEMKEMGIAKEDIFNIFESSVLSIDCVEKDFDGVKGRSFTGSKWALKKSGAYIKFKNEADEEITHHFSKADLVDGVLTPQASLALKALGEELSKDSLNMHNMFALKTIGDPKNSESTEKYLAVVAEKVAKIVPIIRDAKTISECLSSGVAETTDKPNNLKGNIPTGEATELNGSALNNAQAETTTAQAVTGAVEQQPISDNVMDILNATK